jgi:hypothetical protein
LYPFAHYLYKKMAAPFINTGSDLKSNHLVAALVETATRLQGAELAISADLRPNNVQVSQDLEALTATISATLPVTVSLNTAGQPVLQASSYIAAPFVPGTSDLKSDSLPEALLEIAYKVESAELAIPEATRPNNLSISISEGIASITMSAPIGFTLNTAGETVISVVDYL